MCAGIYRCVHAFIHVCIPAWFHVYVPRRMYIYTCVQNCLHVCRVCMCRCVCVCTFLHVVCAYMRVGRHMCVHCTVLVLHCNLAGVPVYYTHLRAHETLMNIV